MLTGAGLHAKRLPGMLRPYCVPAHAVQNPNAIALVRCQVREHRGPASPARERELALTPTTPEGEGVSILTPTGSPEGEGDGAVLAGVVGLGVSGDKAGEVGQGRAEKREAQDGPCAPAVAPGQGWFSYSTCPSRSAVVTRLQLAVFQSATSEGVYTTMSLAMPRPDRAR